MKRENPVSVQVNFAFDLVPGDGHGSVDLEHLPDRKVNSAKVRATIER
jgi:hypothetical protein